ncbi:MAG: type II toxin-antitoxin system ParD family antitoxin [Candidatus Sedimenticola sp. (ex Thyasira tokunagai)]
MATERVNTSLPETISAFVKRQVQVGGFSSNADYVRHVLRKEMKRTKQEQIVWLNQELAESEKSGLCDETPDEIRAGLKKVVKKAVADRKESI